MFFVPVAVTHTNIVAEVVFAPRCNWTKGSRVMISWWASTKSSATDEGKRSVYLAYEDVLHLKRNQNQFSSILAQEHNRINGKRSQVLRRIWLDAPMPMFELSWTLRTTCQFSSTFSVTGHPLMIPELPAPPPLTTQKIPGSWSIDGSCTSISSHDLSRTHHEI